MTTDGPADDRVLHGLLHAAGDDLPRLRCGSPRPCARTTRSASRAAARPAPSVPAGADERHRRDRARRASHGDAGNATGVWQAMQRCRASQAAEKREERRHMYDFQLSPRLSVDEAVQSVKAAETARVMAGGQTLIPTLKQRLASAVRRGRPGARSAWPASRSGGTVHRCGATPCRGGGLGDVKGAIRGAGRSGQAYR